MVEGLARLDLASQDNNEHIPLDEVDWGWAQPEHENGVNNNVFGDDFDYHWEDKRVDLLVLFMLFKDYIWFSSMY